MKYEEMSLRPREDWLIFFVDLTWAFFSADGIFSRVGHPLVYSVCGRSDIHAANLAFVQPIRDK